MSSAGPGVRLRVNRLTDWTSPACRIQILEQPKTLRTTSSDDQKYSNRTPMVFHRGKQLTYGSLSAEAAALAFMATSPYDVRPHMLLAYFGQVPSSIEASIGYGHRYLAAWCARMEIGSQWAHALPFAAADALAMLYWGRATRTGHRVTIRQRTFTLHIAARDYSLLLDEALCAYRLRLAEAIVLFECALSKMERLAPTDRHTQSRSIELPARNSGHLARRAA